MKQCWFNNGPSRRQWSNVEPTLIQRLVSAGRTSGTQAKIAVIQQTRVFLPMLGQRRRRWVNFGYLENPLDPHDPRLQFFFASLFIKFGKQYQVNVGSLSATTLAERLMYILRRGTIRNIIMLALD